ncbi:MAG: ABC transporter ATP-binding protein [Candidatus Bathyarchaeia archaeon]
MLKVNGLKTYYRADGGSVKAVDDVSFDLSEGEALGLSGESGCGKTTAALSIMRLLPSNANIVGGEVLYKGQDIAKMSGRKLRGIRWKDISIVFQGAMNALNPVKTIVDQIAEPILLHSKSSKEDAIRAAERLVELVGIDKARAKEYPHEFSGGMRQRVMIAMALACSPRLVILDEPTTALDVMTKTQIQQLVKDLQKKLTLSTILITHDLSVIAETCDKAAIMYAGKLVEYADVVTVFGKPLHPYTAGLIKAFPNIYGSRELPLSIPGSPPDLLHPPEGCRFAPRCSLASTECSRPPPGKTIDGNHYVACWKR